MIHPYALFRIIIVHPSTSCGQGNVLAPTDRSNITFSVQVSYLPPVTVVHEPCAGQWVTPRRSSLSSRQNVGCVFDGECSERPPISVVASVSGSGRTFSGATMMQWAGRRLAISVRRHAVRWLYLTMRDWLS